MGAVAALTWTLAACGGGGGSAAPTPDPSTGGNNPPVQITTEEVTGTAAVGAAIANATVTGVNAAGKTATAVTGTDGRFTLAIEVGAPYLLKVTAANGTVLYSYSSGAGIANITPLTSLALSEAYARKPLADLFASWATARLTTEAVNEGAKKVNANFKDLFQGKGVDWKTYDFLRTAFTANSTGIDAVLDAVDVQISCASSACSYSIAQRGTGTAINFSGTVDISGINLGGTPDPLPTGQLPPGSVWSLTLSGTVNGTTVNQTIANVPLQNVPTSEAGAQATLQTYGGLSGSVNQQGASLTYQFSNLTTSYQGCGACAVGSEIKMTAKGTVTVSGTVNGFTIPATTVTFDNVYLFTRTQ